MLKGRKIQLPLYHQKDYYFSLFIASFTMLTTLKKRRNVLSEKDSQTIRKAAAENPLWKQKELAT